MGLSAVSGVERAGALNYNENETLPHEVGEEKAGGRERREESVNVWLYRGHFEPRGYAFPHECIQQSLKDSERRRGT